MDSKRDTKVTGNVIPVSVLILTYNEEANISACIGALNWCDDVVVLDSYSQDETTELALELGARVFERSFDNFAGQRNYALETVEFKHDWILHLDADEVMTPELTEEISEVIKNPEFDAYRVPSKMMFMNKWLKYSGMYPTYQVRFGRRDILRFKQVGHGQRETLASDQVGVLNNPYLHYCFSKGISEWIDKHNRYSTDEANFGLAELSNSTIDWNGLIQSKDKTRRRRAIKALSIRLPFRPTMRFLYMYVLKLGVLDGRVGFIYCRLLASYEYWIVLKMRKT